MDEYLNRNRLLWTLSVAQFMVMQIWYNFSAVLSPLKQAWNITNFQAGVIISTFQLGYVIAVFFFSVLSDRHNPQKIFIFGALVTGISSLLFAFCANGFYSALLLRTLAGIGMGGVYVPGMRLLAGVFPPESRGKAIGFYVGSLVVGSGASLLLSGILVKIISWATLITITSLGALFGAFLVYQMGEVPLNAVKVELSWGQVKKVLSRPNLLLNLGYMGHMWELYAMWPWIAPFLVAMFKFHGYSTQDAQMYGNIIGGLSVIIGSIATWTGGFFSDRKGRIKSILVFLVGSIFCSFIIGWMSEWSIYAASAIAILYGFLVIGDSPIFSTAITELVDSEVTGLALGIQSVMGFGVTIIAPGVFGYLVDKTHSWGIAFASLGIGALIGPLALLSLRKLPESYRMAEGKQ
ncbi:MFS transporter [Desulfosporosinus sp. BG]|uniref:MFS transporter n=1 Tax=Desulfosporosinus sp. BG TaxID=1633135 RepID=UPI00083AF810|nr:MFS transporter [Desulfosporosinus sp. BG]ODA41389.1 Transport protein [Desulfosporosinus sp. BG]